jgi:hypothetical protein
VTLFGTGISGRDLILIAGGLFLIWKSTGEVHQLLEGEEGSESHKVASSFAGVIGQIIVIDLVFSLDSIITAVGMVSQVGVMIAAVVASVGLMMLFARSIGEFVSNHPTIKMLALVLPGRCRRRADCRRLRPPRAEGLHLLRDGFFGRCRNAQHPDAQDGGQAGRFARALRARGKVFLSAGLLIGHGRQLVGRL